jgi:hypothetical protein
MITWNSKGGLWQLALSEKIKEELQTCVDGINGSGLPYSIDGQVVNHFDYNFSNRWLAYKIVEITRERASDYDAEADNFLWLISATVSIRFYYSDMAKSDRETEFHVAVVNMLSNYLNDIKTLDTEIIDDDGSVIPCLTWHSFATGREVADVAWFDGGFGSQIELSCQTHIKQ